ncbi:anthranilate phosphoribosyltransferase [Blattabacterium cuenoti]|uniref:anthranilate phosphoribosyltransferase n=1 Tax=Blattabacterium cuenoti TaxID=1653831 RepID=UPI00163C1AC3|nr:anthranilate phosphoribosyltransferase [Blattabacterium cuenoti]
MKKLLKSFFLEKKIFTKKEAKKIFFALYNGQINPIQAISIAIMYNFRRPTVEEINGFREALMDLCIKVNLHEFNAIDIVGTGGDGKNTFNISTLTCFIVAGSGEKVIKHGNFGFSSKYGSSDILTNLGYQFTKNENKLKKQLELTGFCYLHAPIFHPILKVVSYVRKQFGFRTLFNILSPLLNPVNPKNQLLGVSDLELARLYAYLYQDKNINFSIIHSLDGYDEITLTSDIKCYTSKEERIYTLEELGINKKINPIELSGGKTSEENTKIFLKILSGEGTISQTKVVLWNASFALSLINSDSIINNYERAKHTLESGQANTIFKKFINI